MPTARIITRFPERAASLRKTLSDSGYRVEVVPPDCHPKGPADVEYDLDDSLELLSEEAPQPEREFVFASQWRALTSLFAARANKVAVAAKPAAPIPAKSPAPASFSELDQHFVDQPASGPSFAERIAALRAPLAHKLDVLKTDLHQQKQGMARKLEASRAAAAEKRRIAAADAATRRAAELAAAERQRAEERLRQQDDQRRAAERAAELQAQLEIGRKQQAEELERARFAAQERARQEAEQRTRLEAERLRAAAVMAPAPVAASVVRENRRSWPQRLHDMRNHSLAKWNEWRQLRPSVAFANTRQYAWRQAVPVAAGIAIAFVIGWAAATSGSYRASNPNPNETVAAPTAAPVAAVAPTPIHAPKALKPSPVAHKATVAKGKHPVRRSRRSQDEENARFADAAEGGDDVTVIHHYPGKPNLARNKKGGVKTISDME